MFKTITKINELQTELMTFSIGFLPVGTKYDLNLNFSSGNLAKFHQNVEELRNEQFLEIYTYDFTFFPTYCLVKVTILVDVKLFFSSIFNL